MFVLAYSSQRLSSCFTCDSILFLEYVWHRIGYVVVIRLLSHTINDSMKLDRIFEQREI